MVLDRIAAMLATAAESRRVIPPTDLYNEGWMLRLVLHWLSERPEIEHDLAFADNANWYSEALLPSAFLARYRGDKLAESWTHADGVIGHFSIGENGAGDLSVPRAMSQLLVTEAKMFSKLSSGVTNAKYFDQAARNIACIAEVLGRAAIDPQSVHSLGFFVIAPQSRIAEGVFDSQMDRTGIANIVRRRVEEYRDREKLRWYEKVFLPVSSRLNIRCIAWEELLDLISETDPEFGPRLSEFYTHCLEFNQVAIKRFVR